MKRLGTAALLAAAVAIPAVAGAQTGGSSAQNPMYAGLDFSLLNIDSIDGLGDQATGIRGRFGYMFTPMFGAEGHLGLGLTEGSDTRDGGNGDVDLGIDYWAAAYGRAQYPVTNEINIYGLLGFSWVSYDISGINTDNEADLSYGFGADYMITNQLGVEADWIMLTDKENAETSAWSIGAKYQF